jgi:4-amino-4-deoxy-L-arabinose transferase-like glycosyltransferase
MTLSTGALACGVCCVLPFALPAAMLASTGAVLAWFVKIQLWAKILAVLAVVGAWGWIAWQSRRTRRKPARSTLVMMGMATTILTVSMLWPLLEMPIIRMLRA